MKFRLRKIWLKIHRWIGLTIGLLFVLTSLSGSFLAFHHEIDHWLNPEIFSTAEAGSFCTLTEVIAAAEQKASQAARFVDWPTEEGGVWTVWFQAGPKHAPVFTHVYVDSHSGQVVGHRKRGEYLTSWIYLLHIQLLSGQTGATLVGLIGIALILSIASGIYLWWPLWKHSWRAAFALRDKSRFTYDLHKLVGVIAAPILFVVAFTGVYLVFPQWIKPCVTWVLSETHVPAEKLRSQPQAGKATTNADQAVATAEGVFADDQLKRIHLPSKSDGAYVIRVRRAGEVRKSSGNSRIWIDQYDGEILAVRDWNESSAADIIFAWQFPLHNGEAFGAVGRWIVCLLGLTPAVLYVTGVLIWWKRTRAKLRKRQPRSSVMTTIHDGSTPERV
ncbi:PepSY-associated TM helix domain-containing protein [Blastopirellula marina]|uniref:PepSY-associated TM helix n=1 Tax=Blastopirellula marina DSM 3645 TaxID=314230 RepID=A3ZPB2_9BACT|nr:PepSY-associated TM helix domain-containing protein [Blastopirellula marina]EAQ81590.1 PepSY-associated TM helix [Blastopirellula marina DSM 3645]